MKKIYLFALLLLFFKNITSQVVFCPPGAEWSYTWNDGLLTFPPGTYNTKVKYIGDTTIAGDQVKKLSHEYLAFECVQLSSFCDPTYIKQKGDTIFMLNTCTSGNWQILYNFAASPGDSWTNSLLVSSSGTLTAGYTITVQSVNTVTVNFTPLKELTLAYLFKWGNTNFFYSGKATERIGGDKYLFHFWNKLYTDCSYFSGFLCYKDSAFGQIQFNGFTNCDYANPLGVGENYTTENHVSIFPNPSSDFVEFKTDFLGSHPKIEFSDLSGRIVKQVIVDKSNSIDIRALEAGLYILSAFSEEGALLGRAKFLKSQ
jgi:hypothetical protein